MPLLQRLRTVFPFLVLLASASLTHADEIYPLRTLLIADSEANAAEMDAGASASGRNVIVKGVPVLEAPEFQKLVAKYFGQPISGQMLNGLKKDIVDYTRKQDRQVVAVDIPTQDIRAGTLRLGVVLLRYNQLAISGNRWFSSKLLEERLGIKPGDEVRLSSLENAVAWVNTNPFRKVQVLVSNLPNTPGKADLIVGVQDQRPYRFAASYDDAGNQILGKNHYTASVQFGNAFGRDHTAGYQYSTTDVVRNYQAHSFDYRVPLPWRHFVQITGAYVESSPSLAEGLFEQKGRTYLANARYTMPLRRGDNPAEIYAIVDFKETNNNLEFGGTQVLNTKTDTFQASLGASLIQRDQHGGWFGGATITASPGNINSRNTTEAFQSVRSKSAASYVYGSLAIQRLQMLPREWSIFSRVNAQVASGNLIPNEQLSIGGVNTVRGYDPNIFTGDYGYVFATDLQTPAWKQPLPFLKKTADPLEVRATIFYDTAQVFYRFKVPLVNSVGQQVGWDSDLLHPLGSAGLGLRLNVGTNFGLTFDYGWHTTRVQGLSQHGRGHIKAVLAF